MNLQAAVSLHRATMTAIAGVLTHVMLRKPKAGCKSKPQSCRLKDLAMSFADASNMPLAYVHVHFLCLAASCMCVADSCYFHAGLPTGIIEKL